MKVAQVLLAIAYPFLIYFGLQSLGPRSLALLGAALLLLRALPTLRRHGWTALRPFVLPTLAVGLLMGAAAWTKDARLFLLLPVGINAVLLVAFLRTLQRGPSMVERFARLQVEQLSEEELRYCRSVTIVWCAFFFMNGAVAAGLAFSGRIEAWTLYTGAIAYGLMGLLFAGEIVVRSWRFRRYEGAITDPILRRLFPPKPTA